MTNNLKNPMYINMNYTHYAEFLDVSKLKQNVPLHIKGFTIK